MNQARVSAVVCLLVLPWAFGQIGGAKHKPATTGEIEKAVEKLIDEYARAVKKGDMTFFEKSLARDYIGIEADGHMIENASGRRFSSNPKGLPRGVSDPLKEDLRQDRR